MLHWSVLHARRVLVLVSAIAVAARVLAIGCLLVYVVGLAQPACSLRVPGALLTDVVVARPARINPRAAGLRSLGGGGGRAICLGNGAAA